MNWFRTAKQKAHRSFQQGKAALDQEDHDLAISWFNDSLRHDRSFPSGYYGRGFAYLKKGDYVLAIADFSEAIRLSPDNAYCYYFRSVCYAVTGQDDQERADVERARQMGVPVEPDDPPPSSPKPAPVPELPLRAALRETSLRGLDETVRALAGQALAHIKAHSPSQLPALLEALKDESAAVRFGAANSLGDLGPAARSAIAALTRALRDDDPGVRAQAAWALWKIDGRSDLAV